MWFRLDLGCLSPSQGYGTESVALKLMILVPRQGFNEMRLYRIELKVSTYTVTKPAYRCQAVYNFNIRDFNTCRTNDGHVIKFLERVSP